MQRRIWPFFFYGYIISQPDWVLNKSNEINIPGLLNFFLVFLQLDQEFHTVGLTGIVPLSANLTFSQSFFSSDLSFYL